MSLEVWKQHGWLRARETSAQEVANILALAERELTDAARTELSKDWPFNIAYNDGYKGYFTTSTI
jgi:hypothetical protein